MTPAQTARWSSLSRRYFTLDRTAAPVVFGVTVVLVVLPLVFVFWRSVSSGPIGSALTSTWYVQALTNGIGRQALINTAEMTAGSVAIAVPLGVGTAFLSARTDIPWARTLGSLSLLPFVIPVFMSVIGWVMLASPEVGLLNQVLRALLHSTASSGPFNIYTMPGLIWVSALFLVPYVYLATVGAFAQLDPSLEEAARMSGGGWVATLRTVSLPLMAPSISAGVLLTAVVAAGQFVIPVVIGTPANLPVVGTVIWTDISSYPTHIELASAQGFLLAGFGLICLVVQQRLLSRGSFVTVAGRGFRPRLIRLGWRRYIAFAIFAIYLTVAAVLPFLAIALMSFLAYWSTPITTHMLTWDNYHYMFFEYPLVWLETQNSVILAAATATIGMLFCLGLSWVAIRTRSRINRVLAYFVIIPLGVPGMVLALGILNAWIQTFIYGTAAILIIGYLAGHLPFGTQVTTAALRQVSPEMEESARVAGAGWGRALFGITTPLLSGSLISGWIFLYVLILRDLPISILLYSPSTIVMAVGLYDIWTYGSYPRIAAYCFLYLVVGALPLIFLRVRRLGY